MARAAVGVACGLVTAGIAHAEGSILFVGKVAPREREVIRATIEATATPLGWTFGERRFADADSAAILACLQIDRPGTCVGRILQQNGVQQLAVVQVASERGEDGRPQLVVTTADTSAFRGDLVHVEGRVAVGSKAIADHPVDVFLAPAGRGGANPIPLGRAVTDAAGRFSQDFSVPGVLNLATYEIYLASPEDAFYNAALSD
jgi:hypothetical protein